jgi:hypothetical protein
MSKVQETLVRSQKSSRVQKSTELHQQRNKTPEGSVTNLEGLGNIGKVGNTTTDKQRFGLAVRMTGGQINHRLGVLIGLLLVRCSAVLPIVRLSRSTESHVQVWRSETRECMNTTHTHARTHRRENSCSSSIHYHAQTHTDTHTHNSKHPRTITSTYTHNTNASDIHNHKHKQTSKHENKHKHKHHNDHTNSCEKPRSHTVSAKITLAPPPATRFQMRPVGFKMVSLREAPVFSSISFTKRSSSLMVRPNGST